MELEQHAISLDVKLAFNRLVSLIYTLKDDIGQEAANYQLLRIHNDISKVLKSRKNKEFFQEEIEIKKKDEIEFVEFHPFHELNTTLKTNGTSLHNDESTKNISPKKAMKNLKETQVKEKAIRKIFKTNVKVTNLKETQGKEKAVGKRLKTNVKVNKNQNKREVKATYDNPKSQVSSIRKPQTSAKGRNKKANDRSKKDSKKSMSVIDSNNSDEIGLEKNRNKNNSENGLDKEEAGPFSEIVEDESSFILPMPCITTDDLLDSIKKNVINGRYTPPTSMFDSVYGNKSIDNSSVNTSFNDIGMKNNHVVKRMCKVNKKSKAKQNNTSLKHTMKRDEVINEILTAARATTNTTPSILKEVFSQEKPEEFINFSDPPDLENVS